MSARDLIRCLLLVALTLVTACSAERPEDARQTLRIWAHAGAAAERVVLESQLARFNATQREYRAELTLLPEGAYSGQVQAAALAGDLPDILEFDGPYLARLAWQGYLVPLDGLLPASVRADLLPSLLAQGTWRGQLYAVASFDSGLGLYAARDKLAAVDARIPDGPDDAWTAAEFEEILAALAGRDADGAVLDLKLNYPDEWFTYGFSPLLQSAGADLVDRRDYRSAGGVLNGADARGAMQRVQGWFTSGYVDPNLDDAAFATGRVALSWVGHWMYGSYREALGDNLLVLPLPDFGNGMRTGQGSWAWGITRACRNPRAATRFLTFLLQTHEVLAMADANGAVPATRSAIAQSALYRPHGPLNLFARQLLEGYAVPRPRTPGYPVISAAFARAFRDIRDGADVQGALDRAARSIDRDIADNHGYPVPEHLRAR